MSSPGLCVICAYPAARQGHLCKKHRKSYSFDQRYGVYRLKPRRKVSEPQSKLYRNVKKIYRIPVLQEVTFDWYPYARYDIVVCDAKTIFEFDGEQHFKYVPHFHKTREGFAAYVEKSRNKQQVAESLGWKVKRFSYVENVADIEYVRKVIDLK